MRSIQRLALVAVLLTGVWAFAQQPSQAPSDQSQQPASGQSLPSQSSSSQSSSPTSAGMSGSSDVQSKIQSALQQDSTLASSGITVNVTDDKIQLSGTTASSADKDKAHGIAEANAGGRKVEDKIKVSDTSTTSNPR